MGLLQETRASWNFATRQHNAHKRDQAAFLKIGSTLFEDEVALVGEVEGKRFLHVLCNSGQDTLSWGKRGAKVTGVDMSDEAIAFATGLAKDAGLDGNFVLEEVIAFLESTPETFDVVFGSYGCLPWIEDLPRFFRGVRRVLAPGGTAAFLEFHPLAWSFDVEFRFAADAYFIDTPFSEPVGDYVASAEGALSPSGHVDFEAIVNPHPAHAWQQTTATIVNAVIGGGLVLERLVEYPHANGCKVAPGLVRDGVRFVAPAGIVSPPLMLGVRARR